MAGYKFEEAAIAIIQNATRTHARNQKAGWSLLLGSCEYGENKGGADLVWPCGCSKDADGRSKIRNFTGLTSLNNSAQWPGSVRDFYAQWMARRESSATVVNADTCGQPRTRPVVFQQVDGSKWKI
jgi:hypothetical protein